MKHVYKPNRAAVITHQREDTTVCASSCSSPFTSVRWLCMQTQRWRSLHRSKCLVVNGLKRDTSWPLCLFTRREIRRSSVLSSLWSEAAIAADYSKRVRLKQKNDNNKKPNPTIVLFNLRNSTDDSHSTGGLFFFFFFLQRSNVSSAGE